MSGKKKVLVLGGGFGGMACTRSLESSGAKLYLLDRNNHHLFQPLLYQVATAALAAPSIAQPLRSIFSGSSNVEVLMEEVSDIDLEEKTVYLGERSMSYDYLVIALGSRTNYFGHEEWEQYASGLKSLGDAHRIRNQVLAAFERAEARVDDEETIRRLMTCVVIGAGPTGAEMAGSLAELFRRLFRRDFKNIKPEDARVILIDALDRVLPVYSESLSGKAQEQLEELGVEVITGKMVKDIQDRKVVLEDESFSAENIIWTAGVSASPLTEKLDIPKTKAGKLKVEPDCSLPGHPEVFAIGDIAHLEDANGVTVPGVAQGALQMGKHVAGVIGQELRNGRPSGRPAFAYKDKGNLATIGRSRAVADIKGREFSGFTAWFLWLSVHLAFLMGMRNRLVVLMQWFFAYVRNRPGARIIWKAHAPAESRTQGKDSSKSNKGSQ